MSKLSQTEASGASPYGALKGKEMRSMIRSGEWADATIDVCHGHAQCNLVVLPKEYAFEFLLFCNRNRSSCDPLEVTDPGDPEPKMMAPGADLRTDVPLYRVFKDGELVDEPTDIIKYWRDDLVCFIIGSSLAIAWSLKAANIPWRHYGAYRTTIPCIPAGRFHGPVVVTVRAFPTAHDAVRAVQISSRHRQGFHGPPIHIGDPADIGIKELGKPDDWNPYRPAIDPPKPGEIVMAWGCGVTPETVALESKTPFMITHCPCHEFITDRLAEELAIL